MDSPYDIGEGPSRSQGSHWQQLESLVDSRNAPTTNQGLWPRKMLTFMATSRIRDYLGPDCEAPVSQYPLLDGEPASWPKDEEVGREGGEFLFFQRKVESSQK